MKNGEMVAAFEREFAQYVGAKYAIALVNGTATLHTALVALGVQSGDKVAVPPLTMSATTIAALHAGASPIFVDVDPQTWLMRPPADTGDIAIPVSLYGLHCPRWDTWSQIDDAAQTLRQHSGCAFTSYSFQASKILALGEGGMLVTDDEALATRAREFSSLGYRMRADQPRIDPAILKDPAYERHHSMGYNYRMNDITAAEGLQRMRGHTVAWKMADGLFHELSEPPDNPESLVIARRYAAGYYRQAIQGCDWITPQHIPDGYSHDYWAYTVALKSADLWHPFTDAIVRHGGEMPYGAWKLTYQERAFLGYRPRRQICPACLGASHSWSKDVGCFKDSDPWYCNHCGSQIITAPVESLCPVAEDLQPRLVQGQTNNLASAEQNAEAWRKAIQEIGGTNA